MTILLINFWNQIAEWLQTTGIEYVTSICVKNGIVKICILQQFAVKRVFMEADLYLPMCFLATLDILESNVKKKIEVF